MYSFSKKPYSSSISFSSSSSILYMGAIVFVAIKFFGISSPKFIVGLSFFVSFCILLLSDLPSSFFIISLFSLFFFSNISFLTCFNGNVFLISSCLELSLDFCSKNLILDLKSFFYRLQLGCWISLIRKYY